MIRTFWFLDVNGTGTFMVDAWVNVFQRTIEDSCADSFIMYQSIIWQENFWN